MAAGIFIFILIFIVSIQAFLPKLLKPSEAFGIYIPATRVKDNRIEKMKKNYTKLVLIGGFVIIAFFTGWLLIGQPLEQNIVFFGLGAQIVTLLLSIGLYANNHITLAKWKKEEKWLAGQTELKVVDLQFREQLELLPSMYFILPMIVILGLGSYGLSQYASLPSQIPIHWGPSGEADGFSEKSWFSVSILPLTTLLMQGVMLFFNGALKQSGAKIQIQNKKRSREQQLTFRKYTSWLLFIITITVTLLMGYLQVTIIYPGTMSTSLTLAFTIGFLVIILGSVLYYAVKVGQSGTRIAVLGQEESIENAIDADDDKYWKLGLFYVNKEDPSILVEKRFGIGWTINFGHKINWIFLAILIGSVVLITILL